MTALETLGLPRDLIEFIFEAAHIQRWNDHIRPQGFTELDKQAHKMMIMYVLARCEEQDHGARLDWEVLVEGGIFEFLHRVVLTDIKPPIYHELMREKGPLLNKWVYRELEQRIPSLKGSHFMKKMRHYYDEKDHSLEKQILRAAHYLATEWEFRIIYHMNEASLALKRSKAPFGMNWKSIITLPRPEDCHGRKDPQIRRPHWKTAVPKALEPVAPRT